MRLVKRGLQAFFTVAAIARLTQVRCMQRVIGADAFRYASESIGRVPGMRGVLLRQAFYRQMLQRCGQDIYFGYSSMFSMQQAEVSDRAYIGRCCSIGYAQIGAEAMLADHVQILSGGNEHGRAGNDASMHEQAQEYQQVRVGSGAWIGAGAIIMADVGEGAIVGAGAVVNRPIPAGCVAVGVPARVVK